MVEEQFKITEEDKKFLLELSKKINTQDKRATSHVYFMVSDEVKVYGAEEYGYDERERNEDTEDFHGKSFLCKDCQKKEERGERLPDYCEKCNPDLYNSFKWERKILDDHGVYFTADSCDKYIKRRHYQFYKPKSFGLSAYWSEEFKRVQSIISRLTTDKELLK